TNESLESLHQRRQAAGGGNGGKEDRELPPTPILKDAFRHSVDRVRSALGVKRQELEPRSNYTTRYKPRADAIDQALDQMEAAIERVSDDLESRQALGQLQVAVRKLKEFEAKIPRLGVDVTT